MAQQFKTPMLVISETATYNLFMRELEPREGFEQFSQPDADQIAQDMLDLVDLAYHYGQVKRAPEFPNGQREDDVKHSYTLQLVSVGLAGEYFPELDKGKIALFAMVHDMPELLTKDETTFNMDTDARALKQQREAVAIELLEAHQLEAWPSIMELLHEYEAQDTPEARFVRLIDKIMPGLSNLLNQGLTLRGFYGVEHRSTVDESIENTTVHITDYIDEMPAVAQLRDRVNAHICNMLFSDDGRIIPEPGSYSTYFEQQLFDDRCYIRELKSNEAQENA